ncbi:Os01g0547500, partial [Oryza sativa Japonica Group]
VELTPAPGGLRLPRCGLQRKHADLGEDDGELQQTESFFLANLCKFANSQNESIMMP